MNRLSDNIGKVCRQSLLVEKWLIAASLRVGHQWVDAVVRSGQPAVNVRINTVKGFALDLAAPEMDAKMLRPDAFEVAAKAKDVGRLLQEYLKQLDTLRLVDYASVLRMAKN